MRQEFYKLLTKEFKTNPKLVIVLGDIGVHSLKECFDHDPKRIINIGICEQAMIGVCAGLADAGFRVVVHSIAPFVTERCYEQLKLLAYERKNVCIVSVGGSYNYAKLGITHHCPNDIAILSKIPGMLVTCPRNAIEAIDCVTFVRELFPGPMYVRLEEKESTGPFLINKYSTNGVVYVLGCGIKNRERFKDINAQIIFTNTPSIESFLHGLRYRKWLDHVTYEHRKLITVIEPCADSGMLSQLVRMYRNIERIEYIGVPNRFIDKYGSQDEIDKYLNLDDDSIYNRLEELYGTIN